MPSGIPDEGTDDPDAFLGELEASAPEEITGDDIGDQAATDDLDALSGLPGDQEALLDNAENLLDEADAPIEPDDIEENKPGQPASDPPPMGKDMSTETPSGPPGESSSHEGEDIFGDTDIEDLFDEYDAESGASGKPSSQPAPDSGEGEEGKIQAGEESGTPSGGDLDHIKDTESSAEDDDLASLQAELSADLEEIEGSHFHEDRVRAAEDELASLEAELAMDEETPSGAETSSESPGASEDLELDQGLADIEMPFSDEETDLEAGPADTLFQDEESGLRDKLADESASPPPHESPEIYAIPHEDKSQDKPGGADDDLAAMLDNTDFGPELDMPLDTPDGEEIPGMEEPSGEESFGPDALLDTEPTTPLMGDAGAEGEDEPREPGPPEDSKQDESTLEPLVEQSLEKTVEAIVPAILRRIESIVVERLPGIVENIVLREIEKIKRGE
jgi:hypothetical protein